MYPVYKYMESYPQPSPYQRNYVPHLLFYNPAWEAIPPQVKMDPADSPVTSNPRPCNGSFCYPNPNERHGCCNPSYPPGYYSFRPAHSYHPPYSPFYYHPSHREAYPPYFVPLPQFPVEQAQYEYDKNMARNHCCGCPNHTCNGNAGSKVKIEEEKPEPERKDGDSHCLTTLQNYPYPIIWMPPGCIKDKETAEPLERDSWIWNGWVPLDLNGIRSLNKSGGEKRIIDQQTEDKKPQLHCPIIWLPGYDKVEEVEKKDIKDIDVSPKVPEDPQSKFKVIPVKLLEKENHGDKPGVAEDTSVIGPPSTVSEKEIRQKGRLTEKETTPATEKETKVKDILVKQIEENGDKELENAAKKPSPSPVKTSKLPPVCLRVDPLPKKKNGNGTSRSPSPPAAKDRGRQDTKRQEPVADKMRGEQSKIMNAKEKPSQINDDKEAWSTTKEIRVVNVEEKPCQTCDAVPVLKQKDKKVQVEEKMTPIQTGNDEQQLSMEAATQAVKDVRNEDSALYQLNDPTVPTEEVCAGAVTNRAERGERELETVEEGNKTAESKTDDKKTEMLKALSNTEAAILIQSAYRGFEVRKWDPLKKLREIARIQNQVNDVREQINALESSAKMQDEKQQVIINEMIMNLLLQLDTIQGLHPSIRESRKSVARALVGLQEKLDSLATQKVVEEFPTQEALKDDETGQEDASVQMEPSPKPAEILESPINGYVTSDAGQSIETVETKMSIGEQQLEIEGREIHEMPLVDAKSKQGATVDHLTQVESKASCTSSEELTEVHPVNDGKPCSEVVVLVESPLSVNEEPVSEEGVKDEKEHTAANDRLVEPLQIDETRDSEVENPSEAAPVATEEGAASALEWISSVKDATVEELLQSQKANEEQNMMPRSPETCDECLESVTVGDITEINASSQMKVEHVETASAGKDEYNVESCLEPEPTPVVPEPSSPALHEKDAECQMVIADQSLGVAENQKNISDSNIDVTANLVTHELVNQQKSGEVLEGSCMSNAEATIVMVGDPVSEKVGDCQQRILQDFGMESSGKETTGDSSSDICEAVTHPREVQLMDQSCEDEGNVEVQSGYETPDVEADVGVEFLPSPRILEPDIEALDVGESPVLASEPDVEALDVGESPVPTGDPVPSGRVESKTEERELAGENKKLKEMLEELLEAGKQQLTVISDLSGRVRDLEKKLAKKRKVKVRRQKAVASSCMRTYNMLNQRAPEVSTA